MSLLSASISVDYPGKPGALDEVEFEIGPGEALGLVGESGSGKSTVALAILGLLDERGAKVRGRIAFDGRDLLALGERELRRVRGREIALVLQSPMTALNPALRLETHLKEAWRAHGARSWRDARPRVLELMAMMSLPADDAFLRRFPGEVSVGQAQRVTVAMAAMHRPRLLIADEPTSALDPASEQDALELFRRLRTQFGMALLYISHDLPSVAALAGQIAVIDQGRIVERGPVRSVFAAPRQAATQRLLAVVRRGACLSLP